MSRESAVRVVLVYPELLGTYGDGGNALVCRERLARRGIPVQVSTVPAGRPVPAGGDIYLLGGGEDDPQVLAAAALAGSRLRASLEAGAALLAVCAGFQIAGESFTGGDSRVHAGAGLLPGRTVPGRPRAVGELAVEPDPSLGLPLLLGYENHSGRTDIGAARPLGRVRIGTGNGRPPGGAPGGRAGAGDGVLVLPGEQLGRGLGIGTYLHGPVLAQNPDLADVLLSHVVGALPALELPTATALRAARLAQLGHPASGRT